MYQKAIVIKDILYYYIVLLSFLYYIYAYLIRDYTIFHIEKKKYYRIHIKLTFHSTVVTSGLPLPSGL